MGHKPDQRARKKRREREAKKPHEADFRKKLSAASKETRALYEACLRAIRLQKGRGASTASIATTSSDDAGAEAIALLTHPRNGFQAGIKPGGESPGGSEYGEAAPCIIISW